VAADNALRFFIVLVLFHGGYRSTAWYVVTGILMAPAVLLAPLNGAIANSLPKPTVLVGAAMFAFAATLTAIGLGRNDELPWFGVWACVATAAALYGPTRYALLPAAADDTRWPLTRLNGLLELGAAGAVVGGLTLALELFAIDWGAVSLVPLLVVGLGGVALLAALPVRFASDVRRPESASAAIRGFFTDARLIASERELFTCLLGLALLRAVVTGVTGALLPRVFPDGEIGTAAISTIAAWIAWITTGLGLGSLLAGIQRHPRRVLGLVPLGSIGLGVGLLCVAAIDAPSPLLLLLLGVAAGLINVPLAATYQADLAPDARGNGMAVRNFTDYVAVTLATLVLFLLAGPVGLSPTIQLVVLGAMALVAAVAAVWLFRRETMELLFEVVLPIMYHVRGVGPGIDAFPRRGPVLIIANHSAWFDPIWLGKVLPRRLIAMMTSRYFDVPVLRWMMINLAQAIRVDTGRFRRDVPELREAIRALDRGDCVLIFPEGSMRRREEQPLRMFGQGVWHILNERPGTPVVACWIEGGWGSYFSYKDGPPTKKKRFDWHRLIRIAVGSPHTLPPDVLADQRATRLALMGECLQLRSHLALAHYELGIHDEANSE
jgi:1-acyl-sn-glycerol-3-phosphate acyltransferase